MSVILAVYKYSMSNGVIRFISKAAIIIYKHRMLICVTFT